MIAVPPVKTRFIRAHRLEGYLREALGPLDLFKPVARTPDLADGLRCGIHRIPTGGDIILARRERDGSILPILVRLAETSLAASSASEPITAGRIRTRASGTGLPSLSPTCAVSVAPSCPTTTRIPAPAWHCQLQRLVMHASASIGDVLDVKTRPVHRRPHLVVVDEQPGKRKGAGDVRAGAAILAHVMGAQ